MNVSFWSRVGMDRLLARPTLQGEINFGNNGALWALMGLDNVFEKARHEVWCLCPVL